MDTAQLFRDRLLRDLRDIQANADSGFYVHVASHDMRRLCVHICPEFGPLAKLRLHFTVELPSNWPASPPRVWSTVGHLRHPNILSDGLVCCDLFRETAGGYSGTASAGYTPGYTLRGVFKQLLSLFSNKSISDSYYGRGRDLGDAIIVHYVTEAALVRPFQQPGALGERYEGRHDDRRFQSSYTESEHHLEKIWNSDKSEEVVVMTYQSEEGCEVKQLTKKSMMRDPQVQEQIRSRTSRASSSSKRIFKFESRNPEWEKTYNKIRTYECSECGYGSARMPHHVPAGLHLPSARVLTGDEAPRYMVPAVTNQLSRLRMDLLQMLCEYMSDETLHALSTAYRPVAQFLQRTNFFRKRQVRCYYLATPYQEPVTPNAVPNATSVMGIGIALDPRTNRLSCDTLLDGYLCEEAFQKCGVRRTVRKKEFGFFLPLALNYRHFQQTKPRIFDCLKTLSAEVALGDPRRRVDIAAHSAGGSQRATRATTARLGAAPGYVRGTTPVVNTRSAAQADVDSVNVLYKFMNDIITSYMQTCETILDAPPAALRRPRNEGSVSSRGEMEDPIFFTLNHAAERFLPLYWQIIHLLICLCRDNPLILKAARARVRQFINNPEKRSKDYEPDLGELVSVAAVVFACQDEGLVAPDEEGEIGPDRISRSRGHGSSHHAHRYDLRHPHAQAGSSRAPRDPTIRWKDHFAGPLIQEAMTRGVKSTLDACPDLQYFESGACEYRMARTFQHCRTPFRLIALQVSMLAVFAFYETSPRQGTMPHPAQSHLDRQFGRPTSSAITTLTEEVKAVFRLANWGEFFTKVQYENGQAWSPEELSAGLRQCVLLSEERGYHINQGRIGDSRNRLSSLREKREREWKKDHQRRMRGLR